MESQKFFGRVRRHVRRSSTRSLPVASWRCQHHGEAEHAERGHAFDDTDNQYQRERSHADRTEAPARWLEPVRVIGRVPLFYFLVHFAVIHAIAVAISAVSFGTVSGMFDSPAIDRYPVTFPPGWGYSLPGVYAAWIGVVVAVYPLCRWYAAVKQRRRDWWLGYL